jgi:hypothetical protein
MHVYRAHSIIVLGYILQHYLMMVGQNHFHVLVQVPLITACSTVYSIARLENRIHAGGMNVHRRRIG